MSLFSRPARVSPMPENRYIVRIFRNGVLESSTPVTGMTKVYDVHPPVSSGSAVARVHRCVCDEVFPEPYCTYPVA